MGDRCYLTIRFHRDSGYIPAFREVMEYFSNDTDYLTNLESWLSGCMDDAEGIPGQCIMEEANYGLLKEREEWAKQGLRFYGEHGAGGCYGAADFFSDGKECVDIPRSEGNIIVACPESGADATSLLSILDRAPVEEVKYPTLNTLHKALNNLEAEHRIRKEIDDSWK